MKSTEPKLSDYHKTNHRASLQMASQLRHRPQEHARMMACAKASRHYFQRLRAIGE
jgi:hypothetical protein